MQCKHRCSPRRAGSDPPRTPQRLRRRGQGRRSARRDGDRTASEGTRDMRTTVVLSRQRHDFGSGPLRGEATLFAPRLAANQLVPPSSRPHKHTHALTSTKSASSRTEYSILSSIWHMTSQDTHLDDERVRVLARRALELRAISARVSAQVSVRWVASNLSEL